MPTARFCFGLTNDVFSSLKVVDVRWDPSDYNDGMHTPAKLKGCEIARGTTKTWALEVNKNANSANFTLTVEVDNQTTFMLETDPREQVQKDIPDASPVHVESKAQNPPFVYANMKPGWGGGGLVEYVVSRTKPVNVANADDRDVAHHQGCSLVARPSSSRTPPPWEAGAGDK